MTKGRVHRGSKPLIAVTTFVAALVVAAGGSFAIVQAAADDVAPASEADAPWVENVAEFPAADIRRESLTKILLGMEATNASASARAPVEAELEQLGGPDPSVPPLDGPDGEREWAIQAVAYEQMCGEGDKSACAALPEARQRAGQALAAIERDGTER